MLHPLQRVGTDATEPEQDQRDEDGDFDQLVARPGSEKPVVYVGTQIANTISESVSERTVAPIVTMTGSRRATPSRVMISRPSRVWDARSDPTTIAGMRG